MYKHIICKIQVKILWWDR